MKSQFEVFYERSNIDFNSLDESTLIVLDANVMLNFFRYSEEGRQQLFKALGSLKANLFVPYQAALEYHFSRQSVDRANSKNIDTLEAKINSAKNDFIDTVSNALKEYGETIRSTDEETVRETVLEEFKDSFSNFFDDFKSNSLVKETGLIKKDSNIAIKLAEILEGKVGKKFNKEEIEEIEKAGEERYKKKIPPGYKDTEKGNLIRVFGEYKYKQKFGDLILWKEIIRYCEDHKELNRVFFVSDDVKEDWLFETKGETVGIRAELKQELFEASGATIEIFRTSKFLNEVFGNEKSIVKIKKEATDISAINSSLGFLKLANEKLDSNLIQDSNLELVTKYFNKTELLLNKVDSLYLEYLDEDVQSELLEDIFLQFERDMRIFYQEYVLKLDDVSRRKYTVSSLDSMYDEYLFYRRKEKYKEEALETIYNIIYRIRIWF
ncbi:PIN-like domain-containing protein [Enterococcus sp. DIV1368c]|uniref:PIN-like domain-containing protein n=1 Tax=Enterococcus sp. DIV1368c TaxID=2774815 RepID=UPI003F240BC3